MVYGDYSILLGCVAFILIVYYYITITYNYWKVRDVKGPAPLPIVGNFGRIILRKISLSTYLKEVYEKYKKESLIGIYWGSEPILIVKDPVLIKDILIKNFSVFTDRGIESNEKVDLFAVNIFGVEGKRWRPLRTKISPIFSSGKLKQMFHIIVQCSNKFGQYLDQLISKESIVDCHVITAKYTGDVIGTCFFDIDLHTLKDGECEFLRIMKKAIKPTFLREFIRGWLPWLYNFIGCYLQSHDVNAYFMQIVTNVIEYRLKNNVIKHDFADILVDLKKHPEKLPELELTNKTLVAQAFVLFIAGYFTSYTTMSHILHELALNPHIQKQLKEEITNELEKTGGAIEYESIKRMSYLDAIFKETLRKHPAVTHLMRHAVTDYTFSGIKQLRIRKGQRIWIPIRQFQHDPDIFCNPEVFDPERFMGNTKLIDSMYYLPFGTGSRNCIGARFGTYEIKVGIVRIMRNFKVDICESGSQATNQLRPFLLTPNSIYLKFTKINYD